MSKGALLYPRFVDTEPSQKKSVATFVLRQVARLPPMDSTNFDLIFAVRAKLPDLDT
jgi:hypothetical protein